MIRLLTILAGVTLALGVYGQDCKYDLKEIDRFSNDTTTKGKGCILIPRFMLPLAAIQFSKFNSIYYITVSYQVSGVQSVKEGNEVFFILEGGDKIVLKNKNFKLSEKAADLFWLKYDLVVSENQVKTLSQKSITDVRFDYSEYKLTKEVKAKEAKLIKEAAKCIMAKY